MHQDVMPSPANSGFLARSQWMRPVFALLALALTPGIAAADDALPDLVVESVTPPNTIAPGKPFTLQWVARNDGTADAASVPYIVVLSSVEGISVSDRELRADTFDLTAGAAPKTISASVTMPLDVPTGTYYVGVIVDPEGLVDEKNEQNNAGVSEPVLVASTDLSILTTTLPAAELGSHFCLRLDAAGGNGTFEWSVGTGSELPPGLELQELLPDEPGPALATLLCGRPSVTGTFSFTLQVLSAGKTAGHAYKLVVGESQLELRITTTELPVALFQSPYTANLVAIGGSSPYGWSIAAGRLPRGLHLRTDGVIVGAAEEDGRFSVSMKVKDGKGTEREQALDLVVSSPARLTCVTRSLPARQVGESYSETLIAAGGSRPYSWAPVETRRLATGIGETSLLLNDLQPPGLSLGREGQVSGIASEIGRYLWTVEVADASQGKELCTVVVEVGVDHGLTVSTRSLTPAVAGFSYLAKLEATGGTGSLSWSLMDGSRLPAGLTLAKSGLMEGTPTAEQLDGAERRDFAFLLEVRDGMNRVGIAPLSVSVLATQPQTTKPKTTETKEGGCQAAGGSSAAFAAVIGLGFVLLRRRRE